MDNIADVGTHIDNEDIIFYTLNDLPFSYQAFKMAIQTKLDPINLDDLYSLLCCEKINIFNETTKK